VLTAMHDWTGITAVASTTTIGADGREVTAEVTAADGGEVVGTVTFTGGGWSQTVSLDGGSASATVPAGITSATASYDGYADALVATSTSAAVAVTGDLELTASAATRCVAGKVQLVVTARNADTQRADVVITTAYGSKTVSLSAGATSSAVFSARAASIVAGTFTLTGTGADGAAFDGTFPAPSASCG
jgi:hypothetical protein